MEDMAQWAASQVVAEAGVFRDVAGIHHIGVFS